MSPKKAEAAIPAVAVTGRGRTEAGWRLKFLHAGEQITVPPFSAPYWSVALTTHLCCGK